MAQESHFEAMVSSVDMPVLVLLVDPLSFRQVEDILHERGIDISHETVRFWVERFGLEFAGEIRRKRRGFQSNWRWHMDEVFVKINGEGFVLRTRSSRFWVFLAC